MTGTIQYILIKCLAWLEIIMGSTDFLVCSADEDGWWGNVPQFSRLKHCRHIEAVWTIRLEFTSSKWRQICRKDVNVTVNGTLTFGGVISSGTGGIYFPPSLCLFQVFFSLKSPKHRPLAFTGAEVQMSGSDTCHLLIWFPLQFLQLVTSGITILATHICCNLLGEFVGSLRALQDTRRTAQIRTERNVIESSDKKPLQRKPHTE